MLITFFDYFFYASRYQLSNNLRLSELIEELFATETNKNLGAYTIY